MKNNFSGFLENDDFVKFSSSEKNYPYTVSMNDTYHYHSITDYSLFITNHRLCKDSETRVYNNLNSYHSVQNVFVQNEFSPTQTRH